MNRAANSTMKSELKIAIAGGGLLGRLCAWRLAQQGHDVTIYEAHSFEAPSGACWTAAGMISPLSELVSAEFQVFRMGMQGLAIWPQWIENLEAQTGQAVGYAESGSLIVAHPMDDAELTQFCEHLTAALLQSDSKKADSKETECRWLAEAELGELEPHLASHFKRGLYVYPEAHVHSRDLLNALLAALKELEVKLVAETSVSCYPGQVIETEATTNYDCVIDTRGLGAASQLPGLRGVRGEVMIVETAEIKLNRPVRLLHPRYKLYVVPRRTHQFIIGATEIESEDFSPVSLQSTLELGSALYSINPAFAEARVIESQANCRPALSDNLPHVEAEPGLIRANGLFRHGYLLSPVVVNHVLANINTEQTHAA